MFKWLYKLKYGNKLISNTLVGEVNEQDYVMTTKNDYPESFIIKNNLRIRNQGSIGSCCSHAVIRAVEIQMSNKNFIEGSELYHYYMARKHINKTFPKDKGMTIRDGCKTLKRYGICPEKLWKYMVKNHNQEPSKFADSFAELNKNFYPISFYRVINVDGIKTAISNGLPVVFGLRIDSNFMKCKKVWTPGGNSKGGHAQIIEKYDKDYFYIDNSWGKRWGFKGSYKAKVSDIIKHGFDFFVIKLEEKKWAKKWVCLKASKDGKF